jgi:hypothetical protein
VQTKCGPKRSPDRIGFTATELRTEQLPIVGEHDDPFAARPRATNPKVALVGVHADLLDFSGAEPDLAAQGLALDDA